MPRGRWSGYHRSAAAATHGGQRPVRGERRGSGAKEAYKPSSVPAGRFTSTTNRGLLPVPPTVVIYLGLTSPSSSCGQPEDGPGAHGPPIRPCSRWGLPDAPVTRGIRELLPHDFTLIPIRLRFGSRVPDRVGTSGRYVSVALSVGLPLLGVTQHPARWSSDFPPYPSP